MQWRRFVVFAAFVIALLCFTPPAAAQPKVTAALSRDVVSTGQPFALQLSFEGVAPQDLRPPQVEGLEFLGQSTGQQVQVVNTRISRVLTYTLQYRAAREGEFVFPAMNFSVGGQILRTPELKVKVSADAIAEQLKQYAFGTMILPGREFFLGEAIPVEFHLHFQNLAADPSMPQLKAEGFTMLSKLQYDPPQRVATNGMTYERLIFRTALVAAREGKLVVGPFESALSLRVPAERNSSDAFGFPMFRGRYEVRDVVVRSEPVEVTVLPLPKEGRPESFAGAVGSYSMEVAIAPTNVNVGDPVTLKVALIGAGAVESLELPAWNWAQFELYPPTSSTELSDARGIAGRKDFAVVISPRDAGVSRVPEVEFAFFDLGTREYRRLRHPETPLLVNGVTKAAAPEAIVAEAARAEEPDIAPLAVRMGTLRPPPTLLATKGWFLAAQAVPLIALALLWRVTTLRARRQTSTSEQWRAAERQRISEGLKQLRQHAQAGEAKTFFAQLSDTLRRHIGLLLERPAAAITEEAVPKLAALGFEAEDRAALLKLFEACNESQYAPVGGATELGELADTLERIVAATTDEKEAAE